MCDCKVGPGKFEGEPALTFLAWQAAMSGMSDASTGEDRPVDWFRAPLNFDVDGEHEAAAAYGYCAACIEEAEDGVAGLAVWEDGQGFVCCQTFDTAEEFDTALNAAEAEEADEEADEA